MVRELSPVVSNWRASTSLEAYLGEASIPGVEGIDTRAIAKKLRVSGALNACISTEDISDQQAVEMAKNFGGLIGVDFIRPDWGICVIFEPIRCHFCDLSG